MLSCWKPDYAKYPTMRPLVDNAQLAEVLVQGYEDALLSSTTISARTANRPWPLYQNLPFLLAQRRPAR